MYKKIIALLLLSLLLTFKFGLTTGFALTGNKDNLKNFLHDKKEVFVKYEYPSMKITSNKQGETLTLPAGTPIVLRNLQMISSEELTNGSTVSFSVVNDVIVDNKVLIKSGSPVEAEISYAKKKNYAGIAGEITVSDFAVRAVDGTYIPLRATLSSKGEDKMGVSIGLGVFLCVLFLLIQGEDAIIPAGRTKSVYTIMDAKINTSNT